MVSVKEHDDKVIVILQESPETSVTILKFGATVISWKLNGVEQLWLSSGAKLDGTKAVRGGIPLVFPVFGKKTDGPTKNLPQHGFARNSTWEFLGQTKESPLTVQFALSPEQVDPATLALWPGNDFTLILSVGVDKEALFTKIEIENVDDHDWDFNWLFHTYLKVDDIEDTLISNLPGQICYDQLLKQSYEEKQPVVGFHEELDRIYQKVDTSIDLQVVELGHPSHTVKRENLPDVVVWNPWIDKSAGMGDFQPKDGWKNMVCIEPGYVSEFKTLKAGEKFEASQILTKDKLNYQAL